MKRLRPNPVLSFDQISLFGADGVTLNNSPRHSSTAAYSSSSENNQLEEDGEFSRWLGGVAPWRAKGEEKTNAVSNAHSVSVSSLAGFCCWVI